MSPINLVLPFDILKLLGCINNKYIIFIHYRFIPKENGVHYVDVKLNDAHVPDSPFAVMVGSVAADPAMVHAHGDGLENGKCSKLLLGGVS